MTKLRLSEDLGLPLEVAGEAIAIMATRGAGKSYTAGVIVEELFGAGVQLVVLDPTGVFWGLRSGANGRTAGLPISILGGAHGDVPLESTAGKLIADVIVDTGQSLILDLSDFETKGAQTRFVADLVERLYHRKARARTTLHLIIDEANEFAPQRPMRDEPRMLGAMERIVGKGRSRGIGSTLITQRSAALNKNVLDLVDTLVAMRVLGPRDRKAISEWIVVKAQDDVTGGKVIESLPSLPTGTAWVWSPVRGILQKVAIRRIRTFDSYETPKPGVKRAEPGVVATINLSKLGDQIKATAERAEATDPRKLQTRIRELERQVADQEKNIPPAIPEYVVERVEVPVLNGQVERLAEVAVQIRDAAHAIMDVGGNIIDAIGRVQSDAARGRMRPPPMRDVPSKAHVLPRPSQPAPRPIPPDATRGREPTPTDVLTYTLGKAERSVLNVLTQYPDGVSRTQLSLLTGYSTRTSTLGVALSNLRRLGLIGSDSNPLRATDDGMRQAGPVEQLPQPGPELVEYWMGKLGKAEREILRVMVDAYPGELSRAEIAERTGYSTLTSTLGVGFSKLRGLKLVEGYRLTQELMG